MRKIILFFIVFYFICNSAFSQSIECGTSLNVGTIIPDLSGGEIALSQNLNYSNNAGHSIVVSNGHTGSVIIKGTDEKYTISMYGDILYGDSENIKVLSINNGQSQSGTITGTGQNIINTYATIQYNKLQHSGTYTGYYTVSADFDNSGKHIEELCPISLVVLNANITIVENQALNFGAITKDISSDGTIRISTDGNVSIINGNIAILGGTTKSGNFTISASPSTTVNLTFYTGFLYNNGQSMKIDNFICDKGNSFVMPESGTQNINVGADLFINSKQITGAYKGTYEIIVNY